MVLLIVFIIFFHSALNWIQQKRWNIRLKWFWTQKTRRKIIETRQKHKLKNKHDMQIFVRLNCATETVRLILCIHKTESLSKSGLCQTANEWRNKGKVDDDAEQNKTNWEKNKFSCLVGAYWCVCMWGDCLLLFTMFKWFYSIHKISLQ